jgi:hypothetical protein
MVSVFATQADAEGSSLRITSLPVQAFFYDDDFGRWVIFACSARFGDFASHVGRASARVARDLFYRQLAGEHVTEVNEIHFGPTRPVFMCA